MTGSWLDEIGRQLRGVADAFWGEVRSGALIPLLQPVPPWNRGGFVPSIASCTTGTSACG